MSTVSRLLSILIPLTLVIGVNATVSAKERYVLKLSHPYQTGTLHHRTMEWFDEQIQQRSNGRLSLMIFPSGQLMPPAQEIPGILNGQIDMTHTVNVFVASIDPVWGMFDLPFVFDFDPNDPNVYFDDRNRFRNSENGVGLLEDRLEERGIKMLAFNAVDNFGSVYSATDKVIKTPSDAQGMNIRVTGGKVVPNTLKQMGANGIPVSGVEVTTALQQNVIDGLMSATLFVTQNKYPVKSDTVVPLINYNTPLLMSLDKFDSLPEDLQAILIETGNDLEKYSDKAVRDALENAYQKQRQELGMTIYYPTEEEMKEWEAIAPPVWDDFLEEVPEARDILYWDE